MKDIFSYLNDASIGSLFKAELSKRGGYVTFSNSGRRGDSKSFQIGIDSILQTLKDIAQNLREFSPIQDYEEKPWRDLGAKYFSDAVSNATATVQTKPLFSTLSKIIKWANQPSLDSVDSDQHIELTEDVLNVAIEKLEKLAQSFVPTQKPSMRNFTMPLQLICYGAPGTGKSYYIDEVVNDENSIRTTFHPDTDYAAFVGAYKPTMELMPIHAIVGMDVKHARGENGEKAYEQKIIYKYVPQAFLKAYVAAWANLNEPFYLVIEEINRGNCAQIFGDLFQLLDRNNMGSSSYPIHADEDIQRFLDSDVKGFKGLNETQKEVIRSFALHKDNGKIIPIGEELLNGTKLLLPPNLHIWATMNTSDQSLFPIDSAFKRRWDWKYMPISNAKKDWVIKVGGNHYDWWDFLEKINAKIGSILSSEDKKLGYFFCKAKGNEISAETFVDKVIFYLWNDVFKDYEDGDAIFKDEDGHKLTFDKFYMVAENEVKVVNEKIALFLGNLDVKPVFVDSEKINDANRGNIGQEKDFSKYSLNGEGQFSKGAIVFEAMRKYAGMNPNISADEMVAFWSGLDIDVPNLIETATIHEQRKLNTKDPRFEEKSKVLQLPNKDVVYVSNQFDVERINDFISKVNAQDWDIRIDRL